MTSGLLNNFFGIRIPVKAQHKIILGLIPIFLVFFLWYLTTSGRKDTVVLPEGEFEGFENSVPPVGTFFAKKTSLTLKDAKLEYEHKEDKDTTWLVQGDTRIQLGNFPARDMRGSVRISLPPGKIIARSSLPPAEIQPSDSRIEPETNPQEPVDSDIGDYKSTFSYRYEVVESRIFAPMILPSPMEVLRSLPDLWTERSLVTNILFSFLRVAAGFTVAFIIVFPISLLMGAFSKFHSLFAPMMLFGAYLPIPALVPLTMVMFGTTEEQKVMFLALGFAIYLLPLFVQALEEVDNVYLQTGYTLGAKKYQILNKILLPIALPKMYDAMRLGFGIGWGYIILAEMVDMGSKGVGALILISQRRGPREDIYLVLISIVIMAFITDKIWEKIGNRLFPYRIQER